MSQSPKSRSLKSNLSAEAEADADSMAKTEGKFKILEGKERPMKMRGCAEC